MKQKIGVYICQCGSNISDYVKVEDVKEIMEKEQGVFLAKTTMFACADSTQKEIIDDIKNNELDAIVVASCSPKLHLFTFRNVAIRAGLNPYNYVQVNIREQCSWAHSDTPKNATEKAIQLVKAGIEKAKHSVALNTIKIKSLNSVIVVGAGVSGMRASLGLANMGTEVTLIEKDHFVGGRISQWNKLFPTNETGEEIISKLYNQIIENKNITLYTGAEMISKSDSVGNFNIKIRIKPKFINSDTLLDEKLIKEALKVCPVEVEDKFNYNYSKRKAICKNHFGQFPEILVINDDECNKCGECVKIIKEIDLDQKLKEIDINVGAILLT
ncbi:MAG: FAD-dependent oxidoreductase, partial [Bacteroidota bacterium]